MFESIARAYGGHALAVVLSGSGDDGASGIVAIHNAGGLVLCEEQLAAAPAGVAGTILHRHNHGAHKPGRAATRDLRAQQYRF